MRQVRPAAIDKNGVDEYSTRARPETRNGVPPAGIVGAAAVLAALAASLLWVALLIGPYRLASGLADGVKHLERAEAKLSAGEFSTARREIVMASAAAQRARAGLKGSGPLLEIASALPKVDAVAQEIPHLVNAAEYSAAAARGTFEITDNALNGPDRIIAGDPSDPSSAARIRIDRIEDTGAMVDRVRTSVQQARRELEAIDLSNLPKGARAPVTKGIRRAVRADSILADAQAGFAILPSILGANEPRTYLFGMQNSAELRGTGGALLRYAELTLSGGRAQLHEPRTVYKLDTERERVSMRVPEDAWYVAGIEDAQRFGNANWSPDWPFSAKLTVRYGRKTAASKNLSWPRRVDGFFAVDPIVMQDLLKGVGRYRTKSKRPITSEKVLHFLLYKAYAQFPVPGKRRAVLNEVVDSFYSRMLNPKHPSELVRRAGDVLAEKHMQVWLADPAEQVFIERMNWDGAIEPARRADYLYIVQQNVGGNKLNYVEDEVHTLDIELSGKDASVSAEVRIFNGVLQPTPRYILGDSNGFHRPMINMYVPANAILQGWRVPKLCADPRAPQPCRLDSPAPGAWIDGRPVEHKERGKKVWSATVQIPPRQEATARFDYRVPGVIRTVGGRSVYRLMIQRQPKVRPETLVINLELPPGAADVRAPGWTRRGDQLLWKKELLSDVVLEVSWRA